MHEYLRAFTRRLDRFSKEKISALYQNAVEELLAQDALLENLGLALIALDKDFCVQRFNRLGKRYLKKKAVGQKVYDVALDGSLGSFLRAAFGGDGREKEFLFGDGPQARYVRVSLLSIPQESDLSYLIKLQDITNERLAAIGSDRIKSAAILTQAVGNVAHEIKNPLGAISIHIQLLARRLGKLENSSDFLAERAALSDHIRVMESELSRLNDVVTDFLFASRPLHAAILKTALEPILKELATFYAVEFNKSNIAFVLSVEGRVDPVLLDEKLFREAVVNLIQNAFDALLADKSCDKPKLEITLYQRLDKVFLSVRDNGVGISEEDKAHVFQPYWTTKVRGTGLGLAAVYKIIREFGGEITLSSKKGEGAEFLISLPAASPLRLLEAAKDT